MGKNQMETKTAINNLLYAVTVVCYHFTQTLGHISGVSGPMGNVVINETCSEYVSNVSGEGICIVTVCLALYM